MSHSLDLMSAQPVPEYLRSKHGISVWLGVLLLAVTVCASAGTISTFAGKPIPNGLATNIGAGANGIAINANGDVYQADASNHTSCARSTIRPAYRP